MNLKYRIFLFIFLTIFSEGCTRFYYGNIREEKPEMTYEVKKTKTLPVGFYPFKLARIERGLRRNTLIAELDYENPLKENFVHSDMKSFPGTHSKRILPTEQTLRFMNGYANLTGNSSLKEIERVLEVKDKKTYILDYKNEYYLLGVFGPDFAKRKRDDIKGTFLNILCFLTLGIGPSVETFEAYGDFYLFDRNLQLISRMYYPITYRTVTALWILPNEGLYTFFNAHTIVPKNAYYDTVEKLNIDFEKMLNPAK